MAKAKEHARKAVASTKAARPKRTPEEQCAEIERVAREHDANLSEEGFNEALTKVVRPKASPA